MFIKFAMILRVENAKSLIYLTGRWKVVEVVTIIRYYGGMLLEAQD